MRLGLAQPCCVPCWQWRVLFLSTSIILLCLGVSVSAAAAVTIPELPHPCDNNIYCYGDLLHTVQMAHLYADSKTFVDMKLRANPNETLYEYSRFMERTHHTPTPYDIEKFVNENFEPAGSEFEEWTPTDWREHPAFLDRIQDHSYRKWMTELNAVWLKLGKKMKSDVALNSQLYSIIPVANPVIVPGGRFREFYYWDSYWIVKGLLLSEMTHTIKGMLENFLSIVDRYGHIPNGGRVYYLQRSQPPLLLPMINDYVEKTGDEEFLRKHLPTMEAEFSYWESKHSINILKDGVNHTLFRYVDHSQGPRPESYREDVESAALFRTEADKQLHYSELKAAAESGWDFSSRWFIQNGTNHGNLTDLKTKYIIPVDLNAFVCWNADLLSKFHERVGNKQKAMEYAQRKLQIMKAISKVLWLDDVGVWLDYDILNEKERDYFYPTNVAPLWVGCYDSANRSYTVGKVMKYIQVKGIMRNLGGIPTTLDHTGEQWDYPNAWPPLQHIVVEALAKSGDEWAEQLAFDIASRWVKSNYIAYNQTGHMFEKYDASQLGGHGTGGEYEVQLGFGWTNGVVMDLVNQYADVLSPDPDPFETAALMDDSAANSVPSQMVPSIPHHATGTSSALVGSVVAVAIVLLGLSVGGGIWYMKNRREVTGRTLDYRRFYRGGDDYQELKSFL